MMNSINRLELIDQLVEKFGYTKKSATTLVSDFCDIIVYNMENGNCVSISGFGKFDIAECKPRRYWNPAAGELTETPKRYLPRFRPGKHIKLAVKQWEFGKDKVR